jgi:hypothetical protein
MIRPQDRMGVVLVDAAMLTQAVGNYLFAHPRKVGIVSVSRKGKPTARWGRKAMGLRFNPLKWRQPGCR